LRKLHPEYDPTDRVAAMNYLQARHADGELVTGLLYVDPSPRDMHSYLRTVDLPLNTLQAKELCPGAAKLEEINAEYR
jgi:2-oxoglutarate ferredoxin oxidoreductase subunit beta